MGSKASRILFVDDRSKRIMYALKAYAGEELVIATSARDALRVISAGDFDYVSLDHDLSGCDFEDPDSPTSGMEIIRYIEKTGWPEWKRKPSFIIHSKNMFAAHLMATRLQALGFKTTERPLYDEKGRPA